MKIKQDFVTNSSSTSFILIVNDKLKQDEFMELMGVENDSDFSEVFKKLFDEIENNLYDLDEKYQEYINHESYLNFEEYVKKEFSEEVLNKILIAKKENKKIFTGKLSSENNHIETFFCMDNFVEENEKIYFNYENCSW